MFVLIPVNGLCCVLFIFPVLCWFWCPETGTRSINWAQLSRFLPEDRDRDQSLKRCFYITNRMMDNAQKTNNCTWRC
jgi:hypothetical protein